MLEDPFVFTTTTTKAVVPPPPPPPIKITTGDDEIFNNGNAWKLDKCKRDPTPILNSSRNKIVFHQFDIVHRSYYILMFGVTENGASVCCSVLGFRPYVYFDYSLTEFSSDLNLVAETIENDLSMFLSKQATTNNIINSSFKRRKLIEKVEIVQRKNIMYYNNCKAKNFLKVTTTSTFALKQLINYANLGSSNAKINLKKMPIFEGDFDYVMRFMCDLNITGCCWVEAKNWHKIEEDSYMSSRTNSHCQINISVDYKDIIAYNINGLWSKIAPWRIMSFDIECAARKGIFPEAGIDPIIQISNMVYLQGNTEPFIKNVFVLNSCLRLNNVDILSFAKESDMLSKWQQFLLEVDPDILTGYNIVNFDLPYLLNRASALDLDNFCQLGRLKNENTEVTERPFFSNQTGNRKLVYINISGRVIFDVMAIMMRDHKLRSYSLNSVSYHFLKERKEDVHFSMITGMQNESSKTRSRLAEYCAKDALLPIRLLNNLKCVVNYVEMARVTGVPLHYLIMRGQQVKVLSQIMRAAKAKNYIIPTIISKSTTSEKYEGATVIEPKRGYYNMPIATLDFASLYPSIMIAHNLCFTTLIKPGTENELLEKMNLTLDDVNKTPYLNNMFVKAHKQKGLLPEILENLLSARKVAKNELKNETDPFKKGVLDGRQLALKTSANSVYGFTGAQVGKLPCLPISAGVTAYGRTMIDTTSKIVQKLYPNSTVIYGDTDSVMVKFGDNVTRAQAMALGKEAAEKISAHFVAPIKLEFEKIYDPYLLINKKRYAGVLFTNPDKYDKLDCKGNKCFCFFFTFIFIFFFFVGIETIRRDSAPIVSEIISTSLNYILIEKNPDLAVEYIKTQIGHLLSGEIDISKLILTKQLAKLEYKSKQPHASLAAKIAKRDPGAAPNVGDRVSYVIINDPNVRLASDRAEDPLYAMEKSLSLDTNYYLHNQISKPLLRIFEPVFGSMGKASKVLFKGDHMQPLQRQRHFNNPNWGPMSKFVVVQPSCMNCNAVLNSICKNSPNSVFCDTCLPIAPKFITDENNKLIEAKQKCKSIWDGCRVCQKTDSKDVPCANNDCNKFFLRHQLKKNVETQKLRVNKFVNLDW